MDMNTINLAQRRFIAYVIPLLVLQGIAGVSHYLFSDLRFWQYVVHQ